MFASFPKSTSSATLIGYFALFIWAFAATIVTKLTRIPLFQSLSISMTLSFLVFVIHITLRKRWSSLNLRSTHWVIPGLCFSGNMIFYFLSFKYAPPEQADLIVYLWPALVIILSRTFIPEENIRFIHILSVLIGIAGISLVILKKGTFSHFYQNPEYLFGYLCAFLCALCWSTYTIISRKNKTTSCSLVGLYCGLGAPLAWAFHLATETSITPNFSELTCLIIYGIFILGLSYNFWEYGIKRGNFKFLAILSYTNPILSVGFLICFGLADFSPALGLASILVAGSAVIGRAA